MVWNGKGYSPARKGRILIDEPTGNLLQYEEEATEYILTTLERRGKLAHLS
jgi:hypothetical protein